MHYRTRLCCINVVSIGALYETYSSFNQPGDHRLRCTCIQCESIKRKPRFNFKYLRNENKDHKTNNREWLYNYFSFI